MKILWTLLVLILTGVSIYFLQGDNDADLAEMKVNDEPLYWVAPMDANFRRDGPGKSPMGMDLVPVYADNNESGVVKISPTVEHNIGVATTPVVFDRLNRVIESAAFVQFNRNELWHAYPRVEGWIDELYVHTEGTLVTKGDPLYRIYSPALVNVQEEYVSALRGQQPSLVESARLRLLSLDVPKSFIDDLTASRKVSQNVLIRAPRSGVVTALNIRKGHRITPGTLLLEVSGFENVWISAEVFESDIGSIQIGDMMHIDFPQLTDLTLTAPIDFIDTTLDSTTRSLKVRATLPNTSGQIRSNMYAKARIKTSDNDKTILIPRDALIQTAEQNRVVLKTGQGRYKSIQVRTGRMSGDQVEILSGLKRGDEVVTSAQFLLDSESSLSSDFKRQGMSMDDHSQMNHESMNHDSMNHDSMNHDAMGHGKERTEQPEKGATP